MKVKQMAQQTAVDKILAGELIVFRTTVQFAYEEISPTQAEEHATPTMKRVQ